MPYGQPAQLANLNPWPKGYKPQTSRSSRDVQKAITRLRHAAPQAVDYCIALLNDTNEKSELRLRAALAIIDKAIPEGKAIDPALALNAPGIQSLRVEFVSGDQFSMTRQEPETADQSRAIEVSFHDVDVTENVT